MSYSFFSAVELTKTARWGHTRDEGSVHIIMHNIDRLTMIVVHMYVKTGTHYVQTPSEWKGLSHNYVVAIIIVACRDCQMYTTTL